MSAPSTSSAPADEGSRSWIWVVVLAGLLSLLFGPTLFKLSYTWANDPNYSHGYLILPISLFLTYRIWRDGPAPGEGELNLGSMSIAAGIMVHLLYLVLSYPPLDFLALVLILRGVTVLIGGRAWARPHLFPIFFLFFLFPIPHEITARIAIWLQEMVAQVSAFVLDLFDTCFRRGKSIYLAGVDGTLDVAEECSGLRQIMAFLALGALVGHFSERGAGFRLLLLGSVVPIAFVTNVVRVLVMAILVKHWGPSAISGVMHDILGILPIPLGLVMFFGVLKVLQLAVPAEPEDGPQ